ncbi:MAG: DUF4177 domain-containing protein [Rhodobacteraceae bacterium]|uniref:DUF4177 domain-containing protein n=1 Tax=Thioclava marina TaxID=1915077 RepID=A0ABX3MJV7_9RHOB|nr:MULTISPECIES: hypothetical protein [Thioclava]TNE90144.1 MAG: DUF4177 domain-containing protein [Paracoccaceae bacterium]MBD3804971.1 DUF4177 domain-containing protein [Thioclava sp.]OOY11521.1 hypothetical protein BMG00_10425 [Thioclava marina]OOY27350.1 hypothetical protein BMI90_12090 [Thioclava sp. L04-15]TNF10995.1 MAG: DUF4177 domain-containing protein [Paracoccaceae bacterium]
MQQYEYKVVPAPARGDKERGLKTGVERFAHTLSGVMNDMAAKGWDYLRAETLPAEERAGLTGKTTVYHNLLVFRRPLSLDPAQGVGVHAAHEPAANAEAAPASAATPAAEPSRRALSADAPEGRAPSLRANRSGEDEDS